MYALATQHPKNMWERIGPVANTVFDNSKVVQARHPAYEDNQVSKLCR
jgi:hypothetical protein